MKVERKLKLNKLSQRKTFYGTILDFSLIFLIIHIYFLSVKEAILQVYYNLKAWSWDADNAGIRSKLSH